MSMFDRLEDTLRRYEDVTAELGFIIFLITGKVQKIYERTE